MISTLNSFATLFFGFALIMVGSGLQGTLLALRANFEHYPVWLTGTIMSAYYVGYLVGSRIIPSLVQRVGHIRVFAAFSALASTGILVHATWVDPVAWFFLRLITGISFCAIFVVVESWLNDSSTNENRGQVLSVYMIVQAGAYALGQLFLHLSHPSGYDLFIAVSVLLSIATIPILLSATPSPSFQVMHALKVRAIYNLAPLGVVGAVLSGIALSGFWALGPVFASEVGLPVTSVGFFMSAAVLGGAVFQWPLGKWSDTMDRRRVLMIVTIAACCISILGIFIAGRFATGLMVLAFFYGSMTLPVYSIIVAHVNDRTPRSHMVGASTTMLFLYGLGAAIGPITTSLIMEWLGPRGFFVHTLIAFTSIAVYSGYRIWNVAQVPEEDTVTFVAMPPRLSEVAAGMAPEAGENKPEKTQEEESASPSKTPDLKS